MRFERKKGGGGVGSSIENFRCSKCCDSFVWTWHLRGREPEQFMEIMGIC